MVEVLVRTGDIDHDATTVGVDEEDRLRATVTECTSVSVEETLADQDHVMDRV